jgi:uncharacterized short protein YbdD (DUF466 family)
MLSLAVYYSIYETQIVGTFNPKGDLAAYRAQVAAHPSTKCDCAEQSIPLSQFAVPNVTVNRACAWVEADLLGAGNQSSCRALRLTGYCNSVRDACRQSQSTIDWIMEEFNNSVVSSATLIQEAPLNYTAQASFSGDFKIGELIAAGPKRTVSAWASANMPRMMKMIGDIAIRAKALTKKVDDPTGSGPFNSACVLAKPIICLGDSDYDYDSALRNGGRVPINCTDAPVTPSCDITKVADGTCDPECLSPECLFDGGDCAGFEVGSDYPEVLRQSFTLIDALMDGSLSGFDPEKSWLDNTPNRYIAESRIRCDDPELWSQTHELPEDQDLYNAKFAGFDFSGLSYYLGILKTDANYPTNAVGEKVEFRATKIVGCDQYQKELKQNMFSFYSVPEFREFVEKMRELGDESTLTTDYSEFFREFLDPTEDLYVTLGYFNYLENMAAPLAEKHTNLETAMEKLFVDARSLDVDYERYFDACQVSSCTYTYMSASSAAGVAAVVIGLLGGINNAMNATFKFVYSVARGMVVPKEEPEKKEDAASETPATEGAPATNSPV